MNKLELMIKYNQLVARLDTGEKWALTNYDKISEKQQEKYHARMKEILQEISRIIDSLRIEHGIDLTYDEILHGINLHKYFDKLKIEEE